MQSSQTPSRTPGRLQHLLVILLALTIPTGSEARKSQWRWLHNAQVKAGQRSSQCRLGQKGAYPSSGTAISPIGLSQFGPARTPLARWMAATMAPKTCQALTKLLASNRRGAATFDADGTLWHDDVGEGFFSWMMRNRYYPAEKLPMLQEAWTGYKAGSFDGEKMYELMVTGMAGMREQDVSRLARRYFDDLHKQSIYQPMAALVSALQESGFSPWVVSGSPHWVVAAGARHFGIPESRVIGLKVRVDRQGRLTDEVLRPVPWKDGKAQRIMNEIGQAPVIAAGNSHGDLQMLRIASALPLVINPPPDLMRHASWRWHINNFGTADTLARWLRATSTPGNPAASAKPKSTIARP